MGAGVGIHGGFSRGIATSRAAAKPKAISFVAECFNHIVKVRLCLEMKGMLVGVIFHSSVFCPARSIISRGA